MTNNIYHPFLNVTFDYSNRNEPIAPKSFFLVNYIPKEKQPEHTTDVLVEAQCTPMSFSIVSKKSDREAQNIREAEQFFLDKPTFLVETSLEDLEKTIKNAANGICESANRFYANVLLMNKKDLDSGLFVVRTRYPKTGGEADCDSSRFYDRWTYEGYHTFDDVIKLRVFAADDSLIPQGSMVLLYKGEGNPYDGPASVVVCSDSMWFSTIQDKKGQDIFGSYVRWIQVTDA